MGYQDKIKIFITVLIFIFSVNSAISSEDSYSMERIDYTSDYNEQISVDKELFEANSDEQYDDYVVYSYEDKSQEDEENTIFLDKNTINSRPGKTVLKARIEKAYTVNQAESSNTLWDNSKNFKTILNTNPDVLKTLPSIFLESSYKYNLDEKSKIEWGQTYLSSHNGITAGFIDNIESSYDSGIKLSSKSGKLNISAGIYEATHTHDTSAGLVFSTEEFKIKSHKGSFIIGGGVYSADYTDGESLTAAGVFTKYNYERFSLGVQIANKNENRNKNNAACYIYPSLKINNSLTLTGCLACYLDGQYAREEIGLVYKPSKYQNDLSLSLRLAFYNGDGTVNKQRIKIMSEFKI